MKLRERCEEILRLIDAVVDPTPGAAVTPTGRRGRSGPVPAVVPVTTRRPPRPRPAEER